MARTAPARRRFFHRTLALGACLILPLPTVAATDSERLFAELGQGGHIIYWRHATTDRSAGGDRDLSDMDRCERQRNLNEQGRQEARRIGDGFRLRAVPIGEVFSSDFCRNRDTAKLAFGRYERLDTLWNLPASRASQLNHEQLVEGLRQLLATPPTDPATNTVLVGHNLNLRAAADVAIGESEIAVFRPDGAGGFELRGILRPTDFK